MLQVCNIITPIAPKKQQEARQQFQMWLETTRQAGETMIAEIHQDQNFMFDSLPTTPSQSSAPTQNQYFSAPASPEHIKRRSLSFTQSTHPVATSKEIHVKIKSPPTPKRKNHPFSYIFFPFLFFF